MSNTGRHSSFIVLCTVLLAASAPWAAVRAQPVQIGDHPTLGRIVIPLASADPAVVRQRGARVDVLLPDEAAVIAPDNVPRNVLAIAGSQGGARLKVVSGAQVKARQEGRVLILDVLDPRQRGVEVVPTIRSRPNPDKPPAPPAAVETPAPTVAEAPVVAEAPALPVEEAMPAPRSFTVAAGAETGAAAFRLGELGVVVFDDAVEPDREGTLAPTVQALSRGTLMTVALTADEALAVTRSGDRLRVSVAAPTGSAAETAAAPAELQLLVAAPGRFVTAVDPLSGQTLLIGTTRQATGEHARVDAGRSAPGYVLLPTWLGVALASSSDRVGLHPSPFGYTLTTAATTIRMLTASRED